MPIRHLPPDIVSKIAAGEIIERPCYALKELLENAIDAQSTIIDIEADNVGLDRLAVIDNGHGMSAEDVQLAYQRHTTSKIYHEEDLHRISTMGFRGEALSAISSVSTLTIRSKLVNARSGHSITIHHGVEQANTPVGMSPGTHIVVNNLFSNLPARKKFLRNTQTEYRYLIDIITNIALAYPYINFSFTHNDRRILTMSTNSIDQRIQTLLGSDLYTQLVPLEYENEYLKLTGFIGRPQIATRTPQKQYIYVNNRRIHSSLIANTVRSSYGTLLESTAQPVFLLFLSLRPEQIDVNVHPRKETVYFLNQSDIAQSVSEAVQKALAKHNLTYIDARWHKEDVENLKSHSFTHLKHTVNNSSAQVLKEKVLTQYYGSAHKVSSDIVQLHNMYLVTETREGILLVDQHAAHERILYEKFLHAFQEEKSKGESIKLEESLELDVTLADKEILLQHIKLFETLGFVFKVENNVIPADAGIHPEEMSISTMDSRIRGNDKFTITHAPSILKDHPIKSLISETLDDLREDKIPNLDVRSHRMLSYLACRSAIMAGEKLTKERMKTLLEELTTCKTEYTCPHGRPVKVEIPLNSMHKLFKRI